MLGAGSSSGMMMLYLIAAVYYLVYIPLFFYLAFSNFFGKVIFISYYYYSCLFIALIMFNPLYLEGIINEFHSIFLLYIFIITLLLIWVFTSQKQKYKYLVLNTTKDSKVLIEHALNNLGITYEDVDKVIRIVDNGKTLLDIEPKNEYINFQDIQNENLQKEIVQELGIVVHDYKKPSKLWGVFFLFFAGLIIVSGLRFATVGGIIG